MSEFHLLRPILLLFFVPIALLVWQLWKTNAGASRWNDLIDSELLGHLLDIPSGSRQRWPLILLSLVLSLLIIAAAGPTWQRLPQQVEQKQDALIILLDLSLSMRATDIKPSRVGRAHHKLRDILRQRKEGLTALAVFAGDAHTVTPFTDDADTIEAMVNSLVPEIMPKLGSRPDLGIQLSQQLMEDGGISKARVLLVADEISTADINRIKQSLHPGMALSLLAVGTAEGGPIKFSSGGFFKDDSGNIVIPKLDTGNFRKLASETGARLSELKVNSSDINYLVKQGLDLNNETSGTDREFDVWQDMGPWLVLCCLPFALLAFRRGWILAIACVFIIQPQPALAFGWNDLWLTKDQQAQRALETGDAKVAAEKFTDKRWKGGAHYRAKEYDQAVEQYEALSDHYNKGNALARAGKLQQASKSYAAHLEAYPDDEDAAFNKALVDKLLEEQEKNQQQQDQQDQDQEEQENSEQDSQEQQSEDQESQDQQDQQDQQNSEQQNQSDSSEQESEQEEQQSEQSQEEQQEQEQQSAEEQAAREAEKEQQAALSEEELDEAEQALEQWLRKVPDDPGGLLRQKFRYESDRNKRNREYADEDSKVW